MTLFDYFPHSDRSISSTTCDAPLFHQTINTKNFVLMTKSNLFVKFDELLFSNLIECFKKITAFPHKPFDQHSKFWRFYRTNNYIADENLDEKRDPKIEKWLNLLKIKLFWTQIDNNYLLTVTASRWPSKL